MYAIIGGTDTLGMLDLNTGVFTQISAKAVNDYELGVYGGVLYGDSIQCGCLFQLNTSTGVPTFAPTLFQQNNSGFGADNGFGSTTDGLFVMGAAFGGLNYLYSVNPATGAPTQIGSTGVIAGGGSGFLSASNDSSKLYWEVQNGYTDTLYSINTSTGTATLIGAFTFNGYSNTGNSFSMVFTGGTLWANFYGSGFGTINTSNGAQTLVSTGKVSAFFGLAPYPLAAPAPPFIGSMPHLAAEGGWTTTFTLVNKGTTAASAEISFFGPNGGPLSLPINLPQTSSSTTASSVNQTLAPNASFIMQATGPANVPYLEGSAQLASTAATGTLDGFAIFHFGPSEQEAVVPMETRAASSYLLAFDNTNSVLTGVAIANVASASASIPVIIRDEKGNQLSSTSLLLAANGHTSFVLTDPAVGFPVTTNRRGTVEFDTPAGSKISVLGIRFAGGTITTIPSLANVGTSGGLMAHLASGAGWQTTFALVNSGTTAASATLNFFADSGSAQSLPLTILETGVASNASSMTQILAPGASVWIQSAAPATSGLLPGSAQLTTTGNVSGYAIFRYNPNGQEAVVPMESRNASGYLIAFDNTNDTVTGVAINSISSQVANISVVIRDDTGNQIGTGSIPLNANGHTSFILTTQYPTTANIRGTVEFDTPAGAEISVLGIRSPPALTFTTLPPLAK